MTNETNTNEQVAIISTGKDLATSVLIVSVLINLTVLITYLWVTVDPSVSVAVNFK